MATGQDPKLTGLAAGWGVGGWGVLLCMPGLELRSLGPDERGFFQTLAVGSLCPVLYN